jgi:hypothetical protein
MNGVKHDSGKPDWSLLPLSPLEEVVRVLEHGAQKYGRYNWKHLSEANERYYAATLRHLAAWQSQGDIDPESGCNHLAHAVCNLLFILWLDANDKAVLEKANDTPVVELDVDALDPDEAVAIRRRAMKAVRKGKRSFRYKGYTFERAAS